MLEKMDYRVNWTPEAVEELESIRAICFQMTIYNEHHSKLLEAWNEYFGD